MARVLSAVDPVDHVATLVSRRLVAPSVAAHVTVPALRLPRPLFGRSQSVVRPGLARPLRVSAERFASARVLRIAQIPQVYALGCSAPEVLLFHAARRHTIGEPLLTAGGVQSLAFSNPDGRHIAAGLVDGGLQVRAAPSPGGRPGAARRSLSLSHSHGRDVAARRQVFDRHRRVVAQHRHAKEPVFDVKYSPSGRVLAAADGEQAINLYSVKKK